MVVQMFAGEWVFATFIRKDIHTGVLFLYIYVPLILLFDHGPMLLQMFVGE